MRESMKILSLSLLLMFFVAEVAQAQMINYKRRKRNQTAATAVVETPVVEVKQEKPQDPIVKMISSEPKVSNRVERIYDMNRDGVLQKAEIEEFLSDIVSTVKRRGSSSVSSDLLKVFDKNKDRRITRYEVLDIKKYLE